MKKQMSTTGFSLAELLITIAIVSMLAVFTIPKFASNQSPNYADKYTSVAKNAVYMVVNAYDAYRLEHSSIPTTLGVKDLTPYMNFVSVDTSGTVIDQVQTHTTKTCDGSSSTCLKLHSTAVLLYDPTGQFAGTATTNAVFFSIDPDGKNTDNTTDGPGKAVEFWLYYDGKIKSWSDIRYNTTFGNGVWSTSLVTTYPEKVPPWFNGL